jgi:hypothetical protein
MLVRTFLCLSFCSLVTDALSLLETILECCCSCLPKPKNLHRHNLLASQSRYSAGRQREEKRMKLRWDYSPRTCACGRIQSGSCRGKDQPAPFTFFLSSPFLLFSDKYLCCATARYETCGPVTTPSPSLFLFLKIPDAAVKLHKRCT